MKFLNAILIIGSISLAHSAPSIWSHLIRSYGLRKMENISELKVFQYFMKPEVNDEEECQQCMQQKYSTLPNEDIDDAENLAVFMYFLNSCNTCLPDNFIENEISNLVFDINQEIDLEEEKLGGFEKFSCGAFDRAALNTFWLDFFNLFLEYDDNKRNAGIENIASEIDSTINKVGQCVYNRLTMA